MLFRTTFIISLILILLSITSHAQVAINEVMSSNSQTIADEDGDYEDWIELFNYSDAPVALEGYGLSDDYDQPYRWVFPNITIQPGEYLLVWASGKDRATPGSPLHTNFSISSDGEEVLITDPDGLRIDEWDPVPIPTDYTLGRYPNGTGDLYYFTNPTPAAPNQDNGYQEFLEPPVFSLEPGFYSGTQQLTITHDDPGVTIYYTADGSEPTSDSAVLNGTLTLDPKTHSPNEHSMIRTNPVETENFGRGWFEPQGLVEKAHTIRAVAKKQGYLTSETSTGTWFIDVNQRNLPVLSIVTNLNHFFDDDTGIYVPGTIYNENGYGNHYWGWPFANYFQRGEEWERPISLEWFDQNTRVFHQNLGVRIHGGGSRSFPLKSLRLYARGTYGQTHIKYPVFGNPDYNSFKRLILRNSGQDFAYRATMFRDALMQRLAKKMNVETQDYQPSVVFLNGEYWGIHNIRERYDKHWFERKFGVEEHHLDYLTYMYLVKEGSNDQYLELVDFLDHHSLADPENYEYVAELIDIENYLDYVIFNVFIRNVDWPGNNVDYWRYSGPVDPSIPEKDGRWRWLVFDTDTGFGMNGGDEEWKYNMLEMITDEESESYPNQQWATQLIRSLFENETYRTEFIRRYIDKLNTTFRAAHIIPIIEEMSDVIADEMASHIERWNYPASFNAWQQNVELMKTFAQNRPAYQWMQMRDHFELDAPVLLTIDSNIPVAGTIQVNSIELNHYTDGLDNPNQVFPWERAYFTGIPLSLKARTTPGFNFQHWEINGTVFTGTELEVIPEDDIEILAVFEEDGTFDDAIPLAYTVRSGDEYVFNNWLASAPAGTYPEHMAFVYMDEDDPGPEANIVGFTTGVYDLESRTRINGLGDGGFSFINTSNPDGNPGYPGTKLGGAIMAIDTRETSQAAVIWTGGTVLPNSREYHIRLQYRIGNEGEFQDLFLSDGSVAEYLRNETAGHSHSIGPVELPPHLMGLPYVQLLWRYYHTGVRYDEESGQRSKMRIAHILVRPEIDSDTTPVGVPVTHQLLQNYPNPFNPETNISFRIPSPAHVNITVYDVMGRRVAILADRTFSDGTHTIRFDASHLSSGVYLYRMESESFSETRKMMLVK